MSTFEYIGAPEPEQASSSVPSAPPVPWQPTRERPIQTPRCPVIKANGVRCNNWCVSGYLKCVAHMKAHQFPTAAMYADAVVDAARLRLFGDADAAVETLEALTQPGTGDAIRLKAATEILDRVGIRGGTEVKVQSEVSVDNNSIEELTRRLERLKTAATAVAELEQKKQDAEDAAIIDVVVIEDIPDEEQDELPAV